MYAPATPCLLTAQHIDGINLFGLISLASLIYCVPASLYFESGIWKGMWEASVAKTGEWGTAQLLLWGGFFYHLYNQVRVGRGAGRRRSGGAVEGAKGQGFRGPGVGAGNVSCISRAGGDAGPEDRGGIGRGAILESLQCWPSGGLGLLAQGWERAMPMWVGSMGTGPPRLRPHTSNLSLASFPLDLTHSSSFLPASPLPPSMACPAHAHTQLSYMVLDQGISPVTFSVGNTMKRVAVVVSSVMFFKNPVSGLNWIGSFIAILGTYLYSLATDRYADEKKKAAAAAKKAQ